MARSDDEQAVADDMYRYFGREWGDKIRVALGQRSDTAKNTIANLLTDAYLCGVRDGQGFGMRGLARGDRSSPSRLIRTPPRSRPSCGRLRRLLMWRLSQTSLTCVLVRGKGASRPAP